MEEYSFSSTYGDLRTHNGDFCIERFYYDPFGRRLWKEVDGVKTYFFYSEEGFIGEYDANGNEIRYYGYTPDSMWSTDPVYVRIGGIYYFYQNDHLGTPQKIIDASGDVVWGALYDSFGNCMVTVEEIENNLRFPGQYYDEEIGLYYNWNRYYDSAIGRYICSDPMGFAARDVNLYRYSLNNPIIFFDPWGLIVRELTENERQQLQVAIDMISNNTNWSHIGKQIQKLADKNRYVIETDFANTSNLGAVEPWEILNRKIRLNPDLLNYKHNHHDICDLVSTIVHEFIHYNQVSAIPIIMQAIGWWSWVADAGWQTILGDASVYFPYSLEWSAYKIDKRVTEDTCQSNN